MRRAIFLTLLAVMAISVQAFAQEDNTGVSKSLSLYIEGGTGNINPSATPGSKGSDVILDSWSEMGVTYSQNFANAKWFSVTTTIAVCGFTVGLQKTNNQYEHSEQAGFTGYGKLNLGLSKYFNIGVETTGMLLINSGYSYAFAGNQYIKFSTDLEMAPVGLAYAVREDGTFGRRDEFIDLFQLRFDYGLAFNDEWSYSTDVRFRFHGDTAQLFKDNFNIRWNNNIKYANANGFGGYILLRYHPQFTPIGRIDDVHINGGVSYSFDLAKL